MSDEIKTVEAFGRYNVGTSNYFTPETVDDVNDVYAQAQAANPQQRIVIRGGGHSFDGQALHTDDAGDQIILSSENFCTDHIQFNADGTVTLGGGVTWRDFVEASIARAGAATPILLPGSLETGGAASVAGTLSGGCLSRFSGMLGKESQWVASLEVLTPSSPDPIFCSPTVKPDLFNAVVGGFGYIGFVTEATYRTIAIPAGSVAHTDITLFGNLHDMIQGQLNLVNGPQVPPRGVSSAWFTPPVAADRNARMHPAIAAALLHKASSFKGGIFNSVWTMPTGCPPFPLYTGLDSPSRILTEWSARNPVINYLIHDTLFGLCEVVTAFDDDIGDFLFFMDGDTNARNEYQEFFGTPFPIIQQTYVVPTAATEAFTQASMAKIDAAGLDPTDCDMLYIQADTALMSANHNLNGFAVSWAFEPDSATPPKHLTKLLRQLSKDCLAVGGRIHLPKNAHVDRATFRAMFAGNIENFEAIKQHFDPTLLLQNPYSDEFFAFSTLAVAI